MKRLPVERGTCATVVACVLNDLTDHEITVHLLGGDLYLNYDENEDTVWMTTGSSHLRWRD